MVYLALEPAGALEVIELARKTGAAVWVGSDAISREEHYRLATQGVNLTRFEYPLADADGATGKAALTTVAQHHPEESIWVQHVPGP